MESRVIVGLLAAAISLIFSSVTEADDHDTIETGPQNTTACRDTVVQLTCFATGGTIVWHLNMSIAPGGFDGVSSTDKTLETPTPGGANKMSTLLVPATENFNHASCHCELFQRDVVSDVAYLRVQGPPSPPSNLTATPLNETSIKLTWSVPPGVLDEELISYLVEVRNESGLILHSETDGKEYTFAVENPNPRVLYSFIATTLCGTVEGGSAEVTSAFRELQHLKPQIIGFETTTFLSPEAVDSSVTFQIHVDPMRSVDNYSVTVQSIIATEQHYYYTFTHLRHQQQHTPPPASNELRFSMALPANDKYLLNTTACNGAGCSQVYETSIGSFDVQNVSTTLDGDTLTVECWFIEGSRAKGCLVLITSSTGSSEGGPPFYQVIERGEERLVAEEQVRGLPAGGGGRFSVLVFDVEETGDPAPLPAAVEGLYLEMTAVKSALKDDNSGFDVATVEVTVTAENRSICVSCELHKGSPALGCYVIIHPSTEHVSEITVHALKGPSALDCFPVAHQEGNYTVAVFDWEASGVIGDGPVRMVIEVMVPESEMVSKCSSVIKSITFWIVVAVNETVLLFSCAGNLLLCSLLYYCGKKKSDHATSDPTKFALSENESYVTLPLKKC